MIPIAIRRRLVGSSARMLLRPARGAARAALSMMQPRTVSAPSLAVEPPPPMPTETLQAGPLPRRPDLASAPETARTAVDPWAAYRLWIATVEDAARSDAVYTRPAELAGELRYSLLLPDASDGGATSRTLMSLVEQDNLCWELLLPASSPPAVRRAVWSFAADAAERVVFVDCEGAADRGAVLDRLLASAGGDWIAALAEGDVLAPHALDEFDAALAQHPRARILYSDEDELDAGGERVAPLFKPEYAPEQLQAFNYFGRLCFIDRRLALASGGFGAGRGAGAEWSLNLRVAEAAAAAGGEVRRIPRVLCHRCAGGFRDRARPNSVAAIECKAALADHWRSRGIGQPRVTTQPDGTHRSAWTPERTPLVSVIVPNHDKPDLLRVCAEGVLDGTDYPAVELIVVENRSKDPETLRLYAELGARPNVTIIRVDTPFNYSAACNRGAEVARGELLLFLNNDIQVVDPGWLGELVRVASLPGVGVVGTKLNYPDGTLQHAGVVAGVALYTLLFNRGAEGQFGVFGSPDHTRNCLAVMGACQMVRRETFEASAASTRPTSWPTATWRSACGLGKRVGGTPTRPSRRWSITRARRAASPTRRATRPAWRRSSAASASSRIPSSTPSSARGTRCRAFSSTASRAPATCSTSSSASWPARRPRPTLPSISATRPRSRRRRACPAPYCSGRRSAAPTSPTGPARRVS